MPNEFIIKNGFISQGNSIVNGSLTATTYYGDGSNLIGVPNFYVTGGTYSNGTLTLNRQNGSVTIIGFTTGSTGGVDSYVTGFTYDNSNRLTLSQNNGQQDINVYLNQFSGLTVNGIISATTYYGDGSNLTGLVTNDFYVTGGTYNNNTLTLDRQNGSVIVTGFTDYYVTGLTYDNQNKITLSQNGLEDLNIYLNQFSGISINGLSLPIGYALSVTGDTIFNGDVYVNGDLSYNGNLLVTGGTTIQNGLTANTIYTDYIDFNTAYTGQTLPAGRLQWDDGNGTLVLGLKGGNSNLELGLENMALCFNAESTTLTAGTIVYVSGSQGNRPAIKRALATNDGYSVTTLGMVSESILSGAEGFVTTYGMVNNLNTNGLTGGTALWLSPTNPGGFTSTKPKGPDHTVLIAYVVRVHPNVGSVFVNISNGWELDELHDVRINGVTTGDLLIRSSYNGSSVWVNSKTLKGDYTISGNTNNIGSLSATTFYGSGLGLNNIPILGVTNLQNNLDLKFDKSGGTVNGDVLVLGNVTILGSATTINTTTLTVQDNIITLNSNATGSTSPLPINSGIEVLRNSATTTSVLWEETNGYWSAGLNGTTKRIILEGDSLSLLTSGHTHSVSQINNLQSSLDDKLSKSTGGEVLGFTSFNNGLSAYTISDNTTVISLTSVAVYDDEPPLVSSVGIAGLFDASKGVAQSKYSLQLKDGTEGVDKVLVSKTTDGKSNWSSYLNVSGVTSSSVTAGNITVNNINAKVYENIGGLRAVPLATSNAAITANSYDYYMNIRCPHSITASTVLCLYSTLGSDATRVGIYRGRDTTATLVGQGFKAGGTLTTITEYALSAVTGQNLSFSAGEWIVIAVAVGGTTTVNRSSTTFASTDLSWYNTTDSATTGLPTNPRSKAGTLTSFPCFEIF